MNELIAKYLAQHFGGLNFVTRAAGCVQSLQLKEGQTLPVSTYVYSTNPQGVQTCEMAADYYALVPDSKEIGILYFEDERGSRVTEHTTRMDTWEGEIKLVFWANLNRSGAELKDLEAAILEGLPLQIGGNAHFLGGVLNWSREVAKADNPFRKYSYDEARTKYLSPPYGYFSKVVKYTVWATRVCPLAVELNPEAC